MPRFTIKDVFIDSSHKQYYRTKLTRRTNPLISNLSTDGSGGVHSGSGGREGIAPYSIYSIRAFFHSKTKVNQCKILVII